MVKYNVVLVAGHSKPGDPGAVGQGTTEATETIQIVDRVKNLLLPHVTVGVDVVPHDLDYVASTTWINKRYKWDNSDTIVVEVHLNSHDSDASGTETFVGLGGLKYSETKRMAKSLQDAMVDSIGLPDRGLKEGNFYLIQSVNPLACLLEVRFIGEDSNSNAADAKAARGIANGICDFFRQPRPNAPKPKPKPTPKPKPKPKSKITYKEVTKTVQLKRDAELWDFDFTKWPKATSVKRYPKGHEINVVAEATNALGSKYYMADYSYNDGNIRTTYGFNVEDTRPVSKPPVKPKPETPKDPETPDYTKENNTLLKSILDLVKQILSVLTKIFK